MKIDEFFCILNFLIEDLNIFLDEIINLFCFFGMMIYGLVGNKKNYKSFIKKLYGIILLLWYLYEIS